MNVFEDVSSDNSMQISIHEVKDKIYVSIVLSTYHILKSDDIFVAGELLKEDDFSESSLSISCILKCIKVLL